MSGQTEGRGKPAVWYRRTEGKMGIARKNRPCAGTKTRVRAMTVIETAGRTAPPASAVLPIPTPRR